MRIAEAQDVALRRVLAGVDEGIGGGQGIGRGGFDFVEAFAETGAFGLHGGRHDVDDFVPGGLDLGFGVGGEALLFGGALVFRNVEGFAEFGVELALVLFAELVVVGFGERFEGGFDGREALLVGLLRGLPGGLFVRRWRSRRPCLWRRRRSACRRVEIALQDGIELVVVAAGAIDGHAEEGLTDVGGDFGEHFLAALFGIDVAGDQVLGAGAQVAGGDQRFVVAGGDFVAGDLLADEAVVGLVRLEGMDDVVAVAPGVGALEIEFEAVGIGVANDVEPFGGPAFAVGGEASRRSTTFS